MSNESPRASRKHAMFPPAAWMVRQLPARELIGFLHEARGLSSQVLKGFSPKSIDRSVVRDRLANGLAGYSQALVALAATPGMPWSGWVGTIAALDETWLLAHWRELVQGPAGRSAIIALWLDEDRPILARLGQRLMHCPSVWQPPEDTDPAEPVLPADLLPLTELMPPGTSGAVAPPAQHGANDRTVARLKEESAARHKKLKAAQHEIRDLQKRLDKAESQGRREASQVQRQLKLASKQNQALADQLSERVRLEIQQFRHKVLAVPQDATTEEATHSQQDTEALLAQTRQQLDTHGKLNEAYAPLSQIRNQIRQLEEAMRDIDACLAEAIVVQPGLLKLRDRIQEQVAHLSSLPRVNLPDSLPDLAGQLRNQIHRLQWGDPPQRCTELATYLDAPLTRALIGQNWQVELKKELAEKQTELERLRQAHMTDAEPEPPAFLPAQICNVPAELINHTEARPLILVDGCNAMLCAAKWKNHVDTLGFDDARHAFIEACKKRVSLTDGMELVFDGSETIKQTEKQGGLRIVFTARNEEGQAADNELFSRLCELRSLEPDQIIWLVTDDRGLRHRVSELVSGYVGCEDFTAFIAG